MLLTDATVYRCSACSHQDRDRLGPGDFLFAVAWDESTDNPEPTRCPKCGSIDEIEEYDG